jgi:hypothetical protein
MLHVILAGLILSSGAGDGAVDSLVRAAEKLAAAESYTFQVTTRFEGGGGPGFEGGLPTEGGDPVIGRYETAQPIHLVRGSLEIFRSESRSVYKTAGGEWSVLERPGGGREGGRRGRRSEGEAGGSNEPGGDDDGGGRRRRGPGGNPMMSAISVNSTPVPHPVLADLRKRVEDVSSESKDGKTLFAGRLTKAAAREMGSGGPGAWMRGRRGDGREPEVTGVLRVTTGGDGMIERIEFESTSKFSLDDEREIERTRKTTIEVSNVNKTRLEVPKEVRAMLDTL